MSTFVLVSWVRERREDGGRRKEGNKGRRRRGLIAHTTKNQDFLLIEFGSRLLDYGKESERGENQVLWFPEWIDRIVGNTRHGVM